MINFLFFKSFREAEGKHRPNDRTSSLYLGVAAYKRSDFPTARNNLEMELNEAKQAGDTDREGKVYGILGNVYYSLRDYIKAIEFLQQALSIAKEIGHKGLEGAAYADLTNAYISFGDYKEAIEFGQQTLSIAKEIGKKDLELMRKAYSNLGRAYYFLSDYKKAVEFHQQALKIAKEIGNGDSEIKAYGNLGLAYHSLSDYKQAIEFHQQSLRIAKEVGNKDSESQTFINLGNVYDSIGDTKRAIEFYQKSLSISKETGNKDVEGKAYTNLCSAYDTLGDYQKAIEFGHQGLSIAKEVGNKDTAGKASTKLGSVYNYNFRDYKKAIEFHQQSLSIAKEIGDRYTECDAYINLGHACESRSDCKIALDYYHQSLCIAKEIGNKALEGRACSKLGRVYDYYLCDYKKAIEFNQHSLSIAKEIGNKELEVRAYSNLGNTFDRLGNYKKEIEFHKQVLSIAKQTGNKELEGITYGNLGNAYHFDGDTQTAIEFHQQALCIYKEIEDKDSEGKAYIGFGHAYRSLGDYHKAIEFYQQALSIGKEVGNKYTEGRAYTSLGNAYRCLDDDQKAIEFHQHALSIAKEIGDKDLEKTAYQNLGRRFANLHDFRQAEECFESSIKVFEEMRFLLHEKDEWKISFRDNMNNAYCSLWLVQVLQSKTKEALLTAERGRAQALADLMESQYGAKSTLSASKEQVERITNISSLVSSPTTFLAEAFESVFFWVLHKGQEWQFTEKEINDTLECLTNKVYKQIRVLQLNARCEDRSLDDPDDKTVEDLSRGDTNEKEFTWSQDGGDALRQLYDAVIAPISHLIKDEELIIVPDGSSFLIPYAALLDQNSRYLSERLRIQLAPSLTSLRLLSECPEERHSTSGALLVGDPWIETVRLKSGEQLKRYFQLPGAEDEVKMIGQILNVEPLTGKNATKEQVLSRLNSVSLVHIAAHGSAERGEILLSPNLGSSEPPEEKDFLLTMTDVLNAKLDAKLVVLSCCHSGRGEIKAEGVVGIARAFLGAGARSVIASLWEVNDEATLVFMRHFYEHLVKGQSASKSLHKAMKMMRESKDFNAVEYWAPFMLIGDDVTLNFDQ